MRHHYGLFANGKGSAIPAAALSQRRLRSRVCTSASFLTARFSAMSLWWYSIGGSVHGPIPLDDLRTIIRTHGTLEDVFVWRGGMPDWLPVSEVPEATDAIQPMPPLRPATTAKTPSAARSWPVSIDEFEQQLRGRRFGELVLFHVKRHSLSHITRAVFDTIALLPERLQARSEAWIDINNPYALREEFWRSDCSEIFLSIVQRASHFSSRAGIKADADTLLNLFQVVVLSFAYTAHKEPSSKAFIQKAIGIGPLRRFLGAMR
jgi:GYF domain 2